MTGIESAKRKVIRAQEHLDNLNRISIEYDNESNFVIDESGEIKRLHFITLPPIDIVILAGEIVYQLRSALDHLAFELIKLNPSGIRLPNKWERKCEFPLHLSIPTAGTPPVPLSVPLLLKHFRKSLPGITEQAFTFIEGLQPYHSGDHRMQLGWLGQLANIDRHRHLHVVNATVWQATFSQLSPKSIKIVHLRDGAEIQDLRSIIGPFAAFEESALSPSTTVLSVDAVLAGCLQTISTFVIPGFEKLV